MTNSHVEVRVSTVNNVGAQDSRGRTSLGHVRQPQDNMTCGGRSLQLTAALMLLYAVARTVVAPLPSPGVEATGDQWHLAIAVGAI